MKQKKQVDENEVRGIARTLGLKLDKKEEPLLTGKLNKLLKGIIKVEEADTNGVQPTSYYDREYHKQENDAGK